MLAKNTFYTTEEKHGLLCAMMSDLRTLLDARWRMHTYEDKVAFDEELTKIIYKSAKCFVEHYELKPVD